MAKFTLAKKFRFEASHQLMQHDGVCARLHGHSYGFELEVRGPMGFLGPKANMVLDYSEISQAGKKIVDQLDHFFLNEVLDENMPTAEFISQWIYDRVIKEIPLLWAVSVSETDSTSCRFSPKETRLLELGDIKLKEIRERLYSKINIGSPDQCWLFTGSCDEEGYGYSFSVIAGTNKAHRLILWLEGFDIADKVVLHSCDNPPCCNPAHLRVGTHAENENDKDSRHRRPMAQDAAQAKLTNDQVQEFWTAMQTGPRTQSLITEWSKRLGVTKNCLWNILRGWSWNSITGLNKKYKGKTGQ